ncbi:hypothetical protein H6P81_008551 [Aristolochia fimbriata]|uniref:Uncharacterized protein n=1 Tax=Aristolochia fimbriata TaxID=158543 RepID=A0AAV7EL79_ARIFI|nr:hypothetical protein H6P81_008551 [Aristolochia fimbriata]
MACHSGEMPVFAESNLGTRIVVAVSPHIVAGDLKGKLELEHFLCFPCLGEIRVNSLMVKRKSWLYHLPNSMSMLLAFQGSERNWFIHMDVTTVEFHTKNEETGQNQQRAGASLCKEELLKPAAGTSPTSPYRENILSNAVSREFDRLVSLASAPSKDGDITHLEITSKCSPLDESKRGQHRAQDEPAKNLINNTQDFEKKKKPKELNKKSDPHNVTRKDLKKGSESPLSSIQRHLAETASISSCLKVHQESVAQSEYLRFDPVVRTTLCQHSSHKQLQLGKVEEGIVVDVRISQAVHELDNRKDNIGGVNGEKMESDTLHSDLISRYESKFTSNGNINNWLAENGNNDKTIHREEKGTSCSSDRISGVCLSVTGILEQYFSNLDEVNSPAKGQKVVLSVETQDLKQNFCKRSTSTKWMKNSILKTRLSSNSPGSLGVEIMQQATEPSLKSSLLLSPELPNVPACGTIGRHEIGKRLLVAGLGRPITKAKQKFATHGP